MRSFGYVVLLVSIVFSQVLPLSAQRLRGEDGKRITGAPELPVAKPIQPPARPEPSQAAFGKIEAYSESKGAYLRWYMEHEPADNVGFLVHRVGRAGAKIVSEVIPGAVFSPSDHAAESGREYKFFDPDGAIGSAYYIETLGSKNERTRSVTFAAAYTRSIADIRGGDELVYAKFAAEADTSIVQNDVNVFSELREEINSYTFDPDPANHKAVIAQPGARIGVKDAGLVRVLAEDLQSAGIDVDGDSSTWQLYFQGVQVPMLVGTDNEYIEFFGKGTDTLEADAQVYYLINGDEAGKRMTPSVLRGDMTMMGGTKYEQTFHLERNTLYFSDLLNGPAENFFGGIISAAGANLTFTVTGIDRTPGTRPLDVTLQGFSLGAHNIEVLLNGTSIGNITGVNRQSMSETFNVSVDLLLEGNNVLRFQPSGGLSSLFDQMSLEFPRKYVGQNGRLNFYTENYRNAAASGFATPNIRVFDVTNEFDPKILSNVQIRETNGTYGPYIPARRGRLYSAVEDGATFGPKFVLPNDPAILVNSANQGTLIIITHQDFMEQAEAWATYRSGQGIAVKIVENQEIFDEFNYGVQSTHAIRQFLEYAKTNWSTPAQYVLLLGDATVDHRNYGASPFVSFVPTQLVDTLFEETGSDDAVADFNNDGLADLPIGRVASRTAAGLESALAKTIAWEASITPDILDRGALFAHDWEDGYNFAAMSARIFSNLPASVPITTAQSNVSGDGAVLMNAFNHVDAVTPAYSGVYVANYTGHGNLSAWRTDGFFGKPRVAEMTNAGRPSLITALTCLNGYFVGRDGSESLADTLLHAQDKGAVAVWASTGKTTPDVQEVMAKRFYIKLTEGSMTRLGDLVNDAKAQVQAGLDVRRSWALFGDPMLKVR